MTSDALRVNRAAGHPTVLVLLAIVSVQFGAAIAKSLFTEVSPTAMAWLRLSFSALVLLAIRSAVGRGTWRRGSHTVGASSSPQPQGTVSATTRWLLGLGYAACLVGMNWAIYLSFARIPLGIAVTIEFLGPLTVAVLGSRRARDLVWAGLAGAGVLLLGATPTSLTWQGVGFALLAGAFWAGYIVLGHRAGPHWQGVDVLTLACVLGAVLLAAPAIAGSDGRMWHPTILVAGLGVGLLSSVIPYSLELAALRKLSSARFSILMSLEPAAAALAGWIIVAEQLTLLDWGAMACVVTASVQVTRQARRSG